MDQISQGLDVSSAFPLDLLHASAEAGCCYCVLLVQALEWFQPELDSGEGLLALARNMAASGIFKRRDRNLEFWQAAAQKSEGFQIFTTGDLLRWWPS